LEPHAPSVATYPSPQPAPARAPDAMTLARHGRPLGASSVESAVAALRAGGLRVSAARRLVLEALFAAGEPVTVEELAEGLGDRVPRSDVASTYRNLETLEDLGLIHHVHLGHGPGRYVLAGAPTHEYVACEGCGAFVAVDAGALEPVRALVREAFGYEARFSHFPIVGLCGSCAAARGAAEDDLVA
jgi:Fur family ferric uptake transcriptional regulator